MLNKTYLYMLLVFSFINLFFQDLNAAVFQNTTNKNYSYIFATGIFSTETQTAKYIPEFIGSTGETIACTAGIHTLNQPLSTCTFSEVSFQSLSTQSYNPFVYLGYWITDNQNKKYDVSVKKSQPQQEDPMANRLQSPATSTQTLEKHAFDFTKLNLAQEADINALLKTYNDHIQKYPDTYIVAYGVSRGAGTLCTFLAKHQPENIKALILEAPFDTVPHLFKHSWPTIHSMIMTALPKVTSYDPNGDSPIASIEKISKDLPILMVSSRIDDVIPYPCAKAMMRKFAKNGHNKVHLLVLDKSSHSGYAFDNAADKVKYETVVHAFYKHYGLPFDENLASQGADEWKKISGQAAMMPQK